MILNLFKPFLFYRFWAFVLIAFGALSISSMAYAAPAISSNSDGHYYYVEQGDTLSGIARRYDVSVGKLVYLNSLDDADVILIGQRLYIPSRSDTGEQECYTHHKVVDGQTLSEIAKHYGVDLHKLAEINHIHNFDHIRIGQKLCIPAEILSESKDSFHLISIRNQEKIADIDNQNALFYQINSEAAGGILSNYQELLDETSLLLLGSQSGNRGVLTNLPNNTSTTPHCVDVDLVWEEAQYNQPTAITAVNGYSGEVIIERRVIKRLCQFSPEMDASAIVNVIHNELTTDFKFEYVLTQELKNPDRLRLYKERGELNESQLQVENNRESKPDLELEDVRSFMAGLSSGANPCEECDSLERMDIWDYIYCCFYLKCCY